MQEPKASVYIPCDTGVRGVYKTFSKAWRDDGGTATAFQSTARLFANAFKKWKDGVLYNGTDEWVQHAPG